MNTKTNRRPLARLMAVLMALAMVVSVVFMQASAAKANFDPPRYPMDIDKNQITVAAHSQGYITPEVLGLTNTTSRSMELPANTDGTVGMTEANAKQMAVLGVFGSDINENPNPYLYNYFYNAFAQEHGLEPSAFGTYTLSKDVGGGPPSAAASGGYMNADLGITVPASLYLEPDILVGITPVTNTTTGYTAALKAYNKAKKAKDANAEEYNPVQILYEMSHVYSFLQTLYRLSDVVDDIQAEDPTKTTRYGDPEIITGDVEKYVKGLESYVIKQLKANPDDRVTVAVVDTAYTDTLKKAGTIKAGQYVVNDKTCSTQSTTAFSRVGEFVADTATNIVDALPTKPARQAGDSANSFANEYYVVTADQIAEYADIVLFCDVLSSVPENQGNSKVDTFKQDVATNCSTNELKEKVKGIDMMASAFDCVGSIGANSVENLLGMAYYTAYMYPQYLNQFEVAAYWYQNFYHVSDLNKLYSVMGSNFATSSVRDEYAKQYSASKLKDSYDAEAVEAKIIEGMNYYDANEGEFEDKLIYQNGVTGENTGWEIDWTQGIGAGQKACVNGGTTHTIVKLAAKDPTCEETGLTEGEKCSVCNAVLKPQREIAALGHDLVSIKDGKATTCTEDGLQDAYECRRCGAKPEQEVIKATGHKYAKVEAKAATCTEPGLTEGEVCSVCGDVKTAQQEVPALGHDFKDGKCTRCDATDPNYKPSEPDDPTPAVKQNGLADSADKDGNWWYYTDGKIDTTHNGVDQNKYGWWRVENGKVNFNAQSIYQNQFGWWKTTNGKVTFKEEGVFQNGFGWWRVKDSKVDFSAQSIYQNNYGWWKTTNGKVTFKENGLFSNQYGTWKVENSKVNFNFNGTYQGKTIKNGKVV